MRVDHEGILVNIGNKSEGIVSSREMRSLSEEELTSLKVGDEILTRVVEAERGDGSAILSVDQAKEEERSVGDLEVQPACAQACPAQAIVFGDLEDPESTVSKLSKSPRAERPLEELGTGPRVFYLKEMDWRATARPRSEA